MLYFCKWLLNFVQIIGRWLMLVMISSNQLKGSTATYNIFTKVVCCEYVFSSLIRSKVLRKEDFTISDPCELALKFRNFHLSWKFGNVSAGNKVKSYKDFLFFYRFYLLLPTDFWNKIIWFPNHTAAELMTEIISVSEIVEKSRN